MCVSASTLVCVHSFTFRRVLRLRLLTADTCANARARWVCCCVHVQAPETIRDGELSIACDVYAWGVLLWEMITGASSKTGSSPRPLPTPRSGFPIDVCAATIAHHTLNLPAVVCVIVTCVLGE